MIDDRDFAAASARVRDVNRSLTEFGVACGNAVAAIVEATPLLKACLRYVESAGHAKALYWRRKGRRRRGGNFG